MSGSFTSAVGNAVRAALVLCAGLAACGEARAGEIETRDYAVTVGTKAGGEVHMTMHKQDDGSVHLRCDTDINVKILLASYRFVYRGREIWKDGKLVRLDSQTDDNGKRLAVTVVQDAAGHKVRVNNAERTIKGDVWTMSYWSLPDAKVRANALTLLDPDDGKDVPGKLAFVASEKLKVAGQEVTLNHYRVTGKTVVDVWYDGTDRLIRQEWTEQGQKLLIELTRIRR